MGQVLLLERSAHPGFWQSVTGSLEAGEIPLETAQREVQEETGIRAPLEAFIDWEQQNTFEIFPQWRHRYAPGVTHNLEHVFSLCVEPATPIKIAPDEHRQAEWLAPDAAATRCFSWSNRDAILALAARLTTE